MFRRSPDRWAKHWDFILIDTLVLQISFILAYYLRWNALPVYSSRNAYRTTAIVLLLLSIIVAVFFNTMHNVLKRGLWEELKSTVRQCGFVFAVVVLLLFSAKDSDRISRIVMFLAMILYFVLGIITRLMYKKILLACRKPAGEHEVPQTDGDDENDRAPTAIDGQPKEETNARNTVRAEAPEARVIPSSDGKVKEEPVTVNQSFTYRIVKRFSDIVLCIIALIVLSPVFLITAIAIKLEDGGPVVFSQERSGLNGTVFKMFKFRSMVINAPELHKSLLDQNEPDGPAFKMKDDPRVTKVGRFIRRTSIDELPQLINIIKGDMSIVGPRPLPVYEQEQCNEYENQRLLVKPGLTCYWQVMGRSDICFEEWIELDLKYIRCAGILTDPGHIIMTFGAVFTGRGAE